MLGRNAILAFTCYEPAEKTNGHKRNPFLSSYDFVFVYSLFNILCHSLKLFISVIHHNFPHYSFLQYLERRFNYWLRILGTLAYIAQTVLYLGVMIFAPSLAFSQGKGDYLIT